MSKLLQERWQRLAFGGNIINESGPNKIDRVAARAALEPLKEMGFYFAGADTVVLHNLDDLSGKEYASQYPYDSYMGEGPFHIQISIEDNGLFKIHDYSAVDDRFCTGSMPKEGVEYNDLREVSYVIEEMVRCYEEFMDAYQEIDAADAVTNEFYRYIDSSHPVAQRLMKK